MITPCAVKHFALVCALCDVQPMESVVYMHFLKQLRRSGSFMQVVFTHKLVRKNSIL